MPQLRCDLFGDEPGEAKIVERACGAGNVCSVVFLAPFSSWIVPRVITVCCSLLRQKLDDGGEAKTAPTFAPFPYSKIVTVSASPIASTLHCAQQVSACALVKRAANGDSWGTWKKKLMQTKNIKIEASTGSSLKQALGNTRGARRRTETSFAQHCANRGLSTETVLNYLRTQLPQQYDLAEVVGKWVWLDVSPARKPGLAKVLWASGFHWNQRRGVWQHPCGKFEPFGTHPTDPRSKYRCFFPADVMPA